MFQLTDDSSSGTTGNAPITDVATRMPSTCAFWTTERSACDTRRSCARAAVGEPSAVSAGSAPSAPTWTCAPRAILPSAIPSLTRSTASIRPRVAASKWPSGPSLLALKRAASSSTQRCYFNLSFLNLFTIGWLTIGRHLTTFVCKRHYSHSIITLQHIHWIFINIILNTY